MKRIRNLEPAEIVDQVILVNQLCLEKFGSRITNIVYMGMVSPTDLCQCDAQHWNDYITRWFSYVTQKDYSEHSGIAKMIKNWLMTMPK